MKITIDGLNLFQWCKANGKNYQNTRNAIHGALNHRREKRPKKTYEEQRDDRRVRDRLHRGYSKEIAMLSKEEFDKIHSQKTGLHFIGKYNLGYVCRKLGLKYHTVFQHCIRRKKISPEEYLTAKGYDLSQFKEEFND